MCSLNKSTSTWPGMSRSPVNSVKVFLQFTVTANPRVDFDWAGQAHLAVDLGFGTAHIESDGVVDPIAHLLAHKGVLLGAYSGSACGFRNVPLGKRGSKRLPSSAQPPYCAKCYS